MSFSRRYDGPPPSPSEVPRETACLILLDDGTLRVTTPVGRAFWCDLGALAASGRSVVAHWWLHVEQRRRRGRPSFPCPPEAVPRLGQASLVVLSREFGVSVTVVRRWRREHGVAAPGRRLDDAAWREGVEAGHPGLIEHLEADGTADRAACARFGLTRERLRQIRIRMGLPRRGKPLVALDVFMAAVSEANSAQAVAERLGRGLRSVQARARRQGVLLPPSRQRRRPGPLKGSSWPPREGTQIHAIYTVLAAHPEGIRADELISRVRRLRADLPSGRISSWLYRWRKGGRVERSGPVRDGMRFGYTYRLVGEESMTQPIPVSTGSPSPRSAAYDLLRAIGSCPETPPRLQARVETWLNAKFAPDDPEGLSRWNPHLFRRIEDVRLSTRVKTRIEDLGVVFVWELVQLTEADLLRGKNFGRKSLEDVRGALDGMGLRLGVALSEDFPRRLSPRPEPPALIMSIGLEGALEWLDEGNAYRARGRLTWARNVYTEFELEVRDWYRRTRGPGVAPGPGEDPTAV